MSVKAFLDTNIFICSVDHKDPRKASIAHDLLRDCMVNHTGVISFQVVQEFFNAAARHFPTRFSSEDAVGYLTTILRPFLAVHSSVGLYVEAIGIKSRHRLSWYDSLIVAAASEAKCSVLYSEDFQHGSKINGVRIQNPFIA
ncbi:MAG TPA: PIN domain-containing protein [Bryobacteraceae bacterium]|nr:PIN domain-containing protein [Bryobacteraceae bacterium]